MADDRLYFDGVAMFENGATFVVTTEDGEWRSSAKRPGKKFLAVSVSQEKAVDSYNQDFECTIHLSESDASQLRDWLNEHFPQ